MMQIGARIIAARRAVGGLVERPMILRMAGVLEVDLAEARE